MRAAGGAFEGIDQATCRLTLTMLAKHVQRMKVPLIYSAVDKQALAKTPHGSAPPLDAAFRMCAKQMQFRLRGLGKSEGDFGILVCDNGDGKIRDQLQSSFHALRQRMRPPEMRWGELSNIHDDMYFGSSKYSVGIQIADLGAWLVNRRLTRTSGEDEPNVIYDMLKSQLHCAKVQPDWDLGKHYLLEIP